MKGKELEARLVSAEDKRFRQLVRELEGGLSGKLKEEYRKLDNILTACVVLKDGQAIACGAIRELDESCAEVTHVYVKPEQRKNGLGRKVLETLELQALWQGYMSTALVAQLGMKEANRLFRKFGYEAAYPWKNWAGEKSCVCMLKDIE